MLIRGRRVRAVMLAALCAIVVTSAAVASAAVRQATPSGAPRPAITIRPFPATITVDTSGTTIGAVNSHDFGLSFESNTLNSGRFDNAGNLALLMRNLGNWVAADAKAAGTQLRISEGNNACQGGAPGASNSFASALWVINYLLTGATHGVMGFSIHTRPTECTGYTPLCQVSSLPYTYKAQPIYYGMLFARLLGGGHLLPVKVATPAKSDYVTAFALKPFSGGGVHLLVENLSSIRTTATLSVGGNASQASVLRLTAPSLLATSGVRIQGASVSGSTAFKPGSPTIVHCSSGKCPLTLNPYTAALVTIG